VLDYLFTLQEGKTADELVGQWASLETSPGTRELLTARMSKHWLPPRSLEPVRKALTDESLGEAALEIVRFQFAAPEADAEELLSDWDARVKVLEHEGKTFELKGKDLFALPWTFANATPVRSNYKIDDHMRVAFLSPVPDEWQRRSFSVRLRVCAGEAKIVEVSLNSSDHGQNAVFNYRPGTWYMKFSDDKTNEKAVKSHDWTTLELRVVYCGTDTEPDLRNVQLFVDGTELKVPGRHYTLNARLSKFGVSAQGSTAPVLIGGAEWWFD
jgi:hypothetical protein